MKSSLYLIILLLFSSISIAQNISGKAYYESKTTVDMSNWGGGRMSEDQKRQIAERMKSMLEKTYILTFSGNESMYKEEEKLEAGAGSGGFGRMMSSFTAGKQYKNIEKNQILEEREFFGKQFLINDTITNLQWQVGKESKMIGQYLAIRATAIKQVDPNDFSMARRRRNRDRDAEKKEGTEEVKDSTEVRDPMDEIEVPKEVLVTAWFTPQIPVKNGPGEYGGLPGLILEMNIDRTTILCSKIVLNPEETEEIKEPTKGKEVTRKEYNAIVKEKTEEMRQNWRGGGRRGGGRRFGG
ncbi:GLPGLI family protein [Aureisphaera galaxeae]|uniref:GLPGLI family protein n=1 Tax=Aureisphaera galaxeae TaxID=1538023 RepID=UPI0023506108|nr:GLPGLI family protein [Aureisphaera galaxeae]MDC8003319.1 GLPGLI family protein [Aureisphaera galaxeae]